MKMKILVSRTSDGTIGGAEKAACDHARALAAAGHEVVLLANFRTACSKSKTKRRVKVVRSPLPAKRLNPAMRLASLPFLWFYCLIRAWLVRPDIINPHSRDEQIAFTLTKPLHGRKVVWKDPGDLIFLIKTDRNGKLASLYQKLYLAAIRKADAIQTLNKTELSELLKRFKNLGALSIDRSRFRVIPSDIMFEDYDLHARPSKKTSSLVIGTVIRLDKHKGVQYLIKAFKQVGAGRKTELWIVGDGPYRTRLEKLAGGDRRIIFWGYKDDISPYLAGVDIFVQPAVVEGWGRNVKEAMYFGKPVIGSNTGGIAVQIQDGINGLLFEPGNIDELVSKLELLINNPPLRKKLGQTAKDKVLKSGDYVDLVRTRILPLFQEVLKSRQ